MTIEERLEALERENAELKDMLQKVAYVTWFAYSDTKFSRHAEWDNVYPVERFARTGELDGGRN